MVYKTHILLSFPYSVVDLCKVGDHLYRRDKMNFAQCIEDQDEKE